ncbi:ABC transporter permease [Alicyclobacillus fructus]|uniref:ABC transporter permease n=1 Tax=Alicyclobacillus fructus TaxID=2816082 RepID=UPI002E2CFB25|nr:ABC transporter permease subunit [Alicyclobacillus fructus]
MAALWVLYPIARLCAGLEGAGQSLASFTPLWHSLWTSALSSACATAVGFAWAALLSQAPSRLRPALHAISLLPLWTPPFIGAFAIADAYGRAGLMDTLWHVHLDWLYGPWGVTAALAVHAVPIGYLSGLTALQAYDRDAERAARSCGASPLSAFWAAFAPAARGPLASSAAVAFAFGLGDFGVPYELGEPSGFQTAATAIFADLSTGGANGFGLAAWQSVELMALGLLAFGLQALRPGGAVVAPSASASLEQRPVWRAGGAVILILFSAYSVAVSLFPLAAVFLTAVTRAYGLPPAPANWDWRGFVDPVLSALPQMAHTAVLAVAAAVAVAALGLAAAEIARISRLGRLAHRVMCLLYAAPGTAVAVAVMVGFGHALYGTWALLWVAYVAKFYGQADVLPAVRRQVSEDAWRAARSLGGRWRHAYLAAVWPVMRQAVRQVMLLTLMAGLYEVTLSSLLYGPRTETVAVLVLSASEGGDMRTVASLAVWMTLATFAAGFAALHAPADRRRKRPRLRAFTLSQASAFEEVNP